MIEILVDLNELERPVATGLNILPQYYQGRRLPKPPNLLYYVYFELSRTTTEYQYYD